MAHPDRRTFLGTMAGALAAGAMVPNASPVTRKAPQEGDLPGHTAHTQYAINVEMWWGRLPFVERIQKAAALGFPAVEFWPWRNKDLDAIAATCQEVGVEVAQFTGWGFSPTMNNPKNHDAVEAEIAEACKAAHRVGAKKLTVLAGNDQKGMTKEEMHGHLITALKRVAPIAESNDVMLILEPLNLRVDHAGYCLNKSADAVRICREVDSTHVKINWDFYHLQISEGDLCGRLKDGFDQVGYFQLADHPGRFEPGTGEIHYNRVLQEAWDLGYRGYVGTECRPRDGEEKAAERLAQADIW